MPNFRNKIGSGFHDYGKGYQLDSVPESVPLVFDDFRGGFDARQPTPKNASPNCMDVIVDEEGRITRATGFRREETLTGRLLSQVAVHASLDKTVDLVFFDPPFVGIKSTAGITTWVDAGLPAGNRYTWTNHGTELVFSNGRGGVWKREYAKNAVQELTNAPTARAYSSFVGRLVAGHPEIDGNIEPLGVYWSEPTGGTNDWTGLGSGFELLLDDSSYGDEIVALIPMGLDGIAVIMRHNIWIGRATRLRDRPIDFRSAVPGVGFLSEAVCTSTHLGVIGLSDTGVYIFTGTGVEHISEQIDPELLPLDTANLDDYSAAYHPGRMEWWLFTPTETWVYALTDRRWYRRGLQAEAGVWWAPSSAVTTWGQLTGTWGQQTALWLDFKAERAEPYGFYILGQLGADTRLAREVVGENCYIDAPMTPYWRFPRAQGNPLTQQATAKKTEIEYVGAGKMGIRYTNAAGEVVGKHLYELPYKNRPYVAVLTHMFTGQGIQPQIDFGLNSVAVSKVATYNLLRGQRIESTPLAPLTGYPDYPG